MISHAGGSDGKRAYVETRLDDGYSFVILSNMDDIPFGQMLDDVRAIMEGDDYELPVRIARQRVEIAPEIIEAYAGTYSFAGPEGLALDLRPMAGGLAVYRDGEFGGELYPESGTVFFADAASAESMTFDRDGARVVMDWQGVPWEGLRQSD